MSYEILYASHFIKAGDQFIPLIVTGSNNTYVSLGRRARNRYVPKYLCEAYPFTTPDYITQSLLSQREQLIESNKQMLTKYPNWGAYDDKAFGYYASVTLDPLHTSETSFQAVNDFYTNAFANARPIEECPPLIFQAGYQIEQKCKKEGKPIPPHQTIHTTPDLLTAITLWETEWQDYFVIYGEGR